ncbi:head-to-tail joining protein [Dinoroseobacter phage vB_DshS-R4C]|uniref:Head-to-tail joining protein n=1 Tax=Dinoroseobacter phage vB_DshS-R4C TaxID=2590919 RepID=A0ACD6BAB3_9CAUD|nr:Chain M, Head-to-tail joining protein [Dinoroseobacter phage vB_DshS-R4C]8GTF_N Chain N, Head-to-tail joining protein [Dinoroseobacter phage vB_DshS-R4C]8GTF_O Chain O, Head-to-tail joining protein [Dinoroseobacter phage vB_DshS-R4C]8GTF_P Chain P, Head-to-tail joining protein [Dinoroseobacter phage vB_DshS-R4C]8GTF_Q Chain Q, Head-to-tail joining protein [Dinoroseobacter phage vB_DshS-R4C]8GTF_X Chain X, Head-to-tail joining protein [Dinoroseobacter phage vB_DshS-R4C]QDF14257.1 head-to-ta
MIESLADWSIFTDPDVFGEPVTWTTPPLPDPVPAIFTDASEDRPATLGPGVLTIAPTLTLGAAQLPFSPARNHRCTVRGITYRVAEVQPDGSGGLRLLLERV